MKEMHNVVRPSIKVTPVSDKAMKIAIKLWNTYFLDRNYYSELYPHSEKSNQEIVEWTIEEVAMEIDKILEEGD